IRNGAIVTFDYGETFDPYIQLKTINRLIVPNWMYFFILLIPFLVFHFRSFFKELKELTINKKIDLSFIVLFILSIPLKEAWSTIIVLCWAVYLFIYNIKHRFFEVKLSSTILLALFFVPFLFGRTIEYERLNILLSFLI